MAPVASIAPIALQSPCPAFPPLRHFLERLARPVLGGAGMTSGRDAAL
jgi:hypothetical protein